MVFLLNDSFDFLHKNHNQQLSTQRKNVDSNFRYLAFCIKIRTLQRIKRVFYFLDILSIFELLFAYNYRPNFFQQGLNWRLCSCWGEFEEKTINIDAWINILIVQNIQKIVFEKDSSRLKNWCFSVITSLISLMRVTISKLTLRENISIKFKSAGFLNQSSSARKNWIFFQFCRNSTSYFSVT